MVDISKKKVTKRIARAVSTVTMSAKAFQALIKDRSPKGDVFEAARIAGILAAKAAPAIIPMCHSLNLDTVKITFKVDKTQRRVITTAEVVCCGQTGVEMEALTAASVASLTIYDMMKWADKGAVITETRLLYKSGGKSGEYVAPEKRENK
ncbi:MAG: cyclic pyranopterin monophosphate synthase MoaC [Candidatus Omnitrophica bacterium]|nr:cyclic pyranopterin monophosphate synthase MoaC [Candidatus Omnitrophota bacterium]